MGCTITPSTNIRKVIGLWGKKTFDYIHRYENTIPWRCLASCPMVRALFMETPIAGPPRQARRPSPFPSHRRLYPELPPRVRVDIRGDSPYRDRRPIPSDELDPDYYNREVGFPNRICVFEIQPGELDPSYDQPFFDYGGNSSLSRIVVHTVWAAQRSRDASPVPAQQGRRRHRVGWETKGYWETGDARSC